MISMENAKRYCSNYEKIENYDKAVKDTEMWVCHHRLETVFLHSELKKAGWYYDRKPDELIFIPRKEHNSNAELHICHRKARSKTAIAHKGKKHSAESKAKISEASKGNQHVKGKLWYNNGIKSVMAFECPEGFVKGRIYRRKSV